MSKMCFGFILVSSKTQLSELDLPRLLSCSLVHDFGGTSHQGFLRRCCAPAACDTPGVGLWPVGLEDADQTMTLGTLGYCWTVGAKTPKQKLPSGSQIIQPKFKVAEQKGKNFWAIKTSLAVNPMFHRSP